VIVSDDRGTLQHVAEAVSPSETGPRLVVVWENGRRECELPAGKTMVVGRSGDCDLQLNDPRVSRRHAILFGGSPPRVQDLDSANGTWVDGVRARAHEISRLSMGSVIEIGPALVYLRRSPTEAAVPSSEPGVNPSTGDDLGPMAAVHRAVAVAAPSNIAVIILGETGVGKDVIAESIYRASNRANRPFLRLNCAALPDALLESELFGYEVGAFSGAVKTKQGLLEIAHQGTVFFDEIGELPLALQAKLLRFLETGEVMRLGGVKTQRIEVRIIAATNRDLKALVAEKRFREDLYFRLEGFSIYIPPLRERTDEIPVLARTFMRKACREAGREPLQISQAADEHLRTYGWPGNVRQLKNAIERAVLLCSGDTIEVEHLTLERGTSPTIRPTTLTPTFVPETPSVGLPPQADAEKKAIVDALQKAAGNQSRAARLLGISRGTLLRRLNAYGFARPRGRRESEGES
jgi:DNA-binding NtrC family response regulator